MPITMNNIPVAQERHLQDSAPQIYRWAYRLLQNHQDALDATQSVLLRMLQSPRSDTTSKPAWIRKVTTNYCIDQLRKKRPQRLQIEPPGHDTAVAEELNARDQHARVIDALQTLTESQRLVLLAKTYDGETFAHIAESMNLTVSSVKTHYLRALQNMRHRLKKNSEN